MYKTSLISLLALTMFCAGCASTNSDQVTSSEPEPLVLDNTQVFTHYSPTLDHTFRLRVALPGSYSWNESASYPLIIKLDGQWDFPLAVGAYNCITFDGQMPETVIMGIDWGDIEGDVHAIRARDLLPKAPSFYPDGGHAKTFLKVLIDEIMPEMENRFRLNGERVLIGGSWSAVFATYALFEQPEAFTGAIAIAGDYASASEIFEQQIRTLENTAALDGKRLYLGVGEWDQPLASQTATLVETLHQTELPGFQLHFDKLPGFGHSGMNLPGYAGGYQHVFQRANKTLSPAQLEAVSGKYRSSKEGSQDLIFVADENRLVAQMPSGEAIPLRAESETEFYHPGRRFDVRFTSDKVSIGYPFHSEEYQRIE